MLVLEGIHGGYGPKQVIHGISLEVREAEVVALMGRNGMGKTTTVNSIMGYLPLSAGGIRFGRHVLTGLAPHNIARLGIGLVPEGRRIFPNLTVEENLVATAANRAQRTQAWDLKRVYELFPRLEERSRNMGSQLSGGEQQMLAISRALMTNPSLLILDEATEGLAPLVRAEIWGCLKALKLTGLAILVIDKHAEVLATLADRHFILEKGVMKWSGSSAQLLAAHEVRERYLGL